MQREKNLVFFRFEARHKIPTAKYQSFTDAGKAKSFIRNAPFNALVVKASGLAAGKGVIVAKDKEEGKFKYSILHVTSAYCRLNIQHAMQSTKFLAIRNLDQLVIP